MKNNFNKYFSRYIIPAIVALRLVVFVSDPSMVLAAGNFETGSIKAAQTELKQTEDQPLSTADFLALTNQARALQGLKPLVINQDLTKAAEAKANDMVAQNYWDHFRPSDQKSPWDFMHEANYNYKVAGENLARGFKTAEGITKAWLNSPSHRANLLSPKYSEVAFAFTQTTDSNGQPILITVQMFGSR